jgi:hypothetical protein
VLLTNLVGICVVVTFIVEYRIKAVEHIVPESDTHPKLIKN